MHPKTIWGMSHFASRGTDMTLLSRRQVLATLAALSAISMLPAGIANAADKIKVAGIYTQPIQQKWDARLHQALELAKAAGKIEYSFSEKVSNTDYIRVLREYAESGVQLIVGEAFGISRDASKVAAFSYTHLTLPTIYSV
eukprot:TRINITY_DN27044_c0_g1_i1.p2 TRINITY_DN27044_c0_g1~~TRINITY_DN27044_c0_g1_i1.p2  ORF type:complete len:141 (+),score=16.82 TRINITY_DN27044_c0_g1_i1:107-529(+)